MRRSRQLKQRNQFEELALPHLDALYGAAYRLTRNPIYLGMTTAYLGAGLVADSLWVVLLVVPVLLIIHFGVVLREEAYLAGKFGGRYRDYVRTVRRWV